MNVTCIMCIYSSVYEYMNVCGHYWTIHKLRSLANLFHKFAKWLSTKEILLCITLSSYRHDHSLAHHDNCQYRRRTRAIEPLSLLINHLTEREKGNSYIYIYAYSKCNNNVYQQTNRSVSHQWVFGHHQTHVITSQRLYVRNVLLLLLLL